MGYSAYQGLNWETVVTVFLFRI